MYMWEVDLVDIGRFVSQGSPAEISFRRTFCIYAASVACWKQADERMLGVTNVDGVLYEMLV